MTAVKILAAAVVAVVVAWFGVVDYAATVDAEWEALNG